MNSTKYLDTLYKELQSIYPEVAAEIAKDAKSMLDMAEHSPDKFIEMLDKSSNDFSEFIDEIKMHNTRHALGGSK